MNKKVKAKIAGIHCKSCKTLIETEVGALEGVENLDVNYQTGECSILFDEQKVSKKEVFRAIEKLNYKVTENEPQKKTQAKTPNRFVISGILLLIFALGYFAIKELGLLEILSKLNEPKISYSLVFLIGILASFHCVGMCGGLVVTYTARHQSKSSEDNKNKTQPHLQYNLGRLVSYTAIGATLGGFGSFFGISPTFTGFVTLGAGVFMILMGLSLLTQFKWLEKVKLKTPSFIARFLYRQKYSGKPKGPFIIGILNGFMPCGPLQAMQLYSLASGSITRGALSMGIYALGTVPLMFGFGSFISLISGGKINKIMKFSGAMVIILGLIMLNRGFTNFGYGFGGFSERKEIGQDKNQVRDSEEFQEVKMDLTYRGYSPNVLFIKKGVPVRWIVNVQQMTGCTNEIILPEYNIKKKLLYGENIIEFVPQKAGEIKFSCWMQMVWGKFVVSE